MITDPLAAAVVVFYALRWAWANVRFLVPAAMGLWGLFLLSELLRGFEHFSEQLAAVDRRLNAIQEATVERGSHLEDIRDQFEGIGGQAQEILQHMGDVTSQMPEIERDLQRAIKQLGDIASGIDSLVEAGTGKQND